MDLLSFYFLTILSMTIIAIDVSKETLDCLVGTDLHSAVSAKIENRLEALQEYIKQLPTQNALVIMESTGDYHLMAAQCFLRHGYKVKILNPLLTKQFTNATIRKVKTDKADAEKIFKLALAGEGGEVSLEDITNPMKELLRLSHFMTKLKTQLKLKLQSVQTKKLAGEEAEREIMDLIDRMAEVVETLDGKVIDKGNNQADLIDSIPGFSAKLSHVVVAECGDVLRFKDSKALVAYAGLDPKTVQSGHSIDRHGRLTKRGSRFLRYALYLAARVAWRHDPELYEYYEKKRQEGRSFTEVMCMISRKLLHRIYVVVKEQRPYEIHKKLA